MTAIAIKKDKLRATAGSELAYKLFAISPAITGKQITRLSSRTVNENTIGKTAGTYVLLGDRAVEMSAELFQCISADAMENGISLEQAYVEEMAARAELDRKLPPLLLDWGKDSGAPAYMAQRPG